VSTTLYNILTESEVYSNKGMLENIFLQFIFFSFFAIKNLNCLNFTNYDAYYNKNMGTTPKINVIYIFSDTKENFLQLILFLFV